MIVCKGRKRSTNASPVSIGEIAYCHELSWISVPVELNLWSIAGSLSTNCEMNQAG